MQQLGKTAQHIISLWNTAQHISLWNTAQHSRYHTYIFRYRVSLSSLCYQIIWFPACLCWLWGSVHSVNGIITYSGLLQWSGGATGSLMRIEMKRQQQGVTVVYLYLQPGSPTLIIFITITRTTLAPVYVSWTFRKMKVGTNNRQQHVWHKHCNSSRCFVRTFFCLLFRTNRQNRLS